MSQDQNQQSDPFDSLNAFVSNLEKSLGKSLDPLNKVAKQMGSGKFGKNAKSFGDAMKGMAGASVNSVKMEIIMKLLEPFMKLLSLLEIPIDALSALLMMMVVQLFPTLIPYLIDFSKMLLDLAPIFIIVGKALAFVMELQLKFGQFMKGVFLEGLTIVYLFLKDKLLPTWEKIKAFFVAFGDFLVKIFQPLWVAMKTSFEVLKKAWEDSGGKIFGKNGFIAKAFEGLFDIVKSITNGIIGSINRLIIEFNRIPGVNINEIPFLANGGLAFGPQLAVIGDNPNASNDPEIVSPLSKLEQMGFGKNKALLAEMEETNSLLRAQNKLLMGMMKRRR